MERRFQVYIEQVLDQIHAEMEIKQQIRQSLTEHIEVLIEQYGSIAYQYLTPVNEVAAEFNDNLLADHPVYLPPRPYWAKRPGYRRISSKRIFNLPLYHITDGYNPITGEFEIAKGIIAIGPVAVGGLAIGGLSCGVLSFGGLGIGLLAALGGFAIAGAVAIGGMAIGGLCAMGGAAISAGLALGGFASGHVAIGGEAMGEYFYKTQTGEGNAVVWFQQHAPYFVKYFQ